MQQERAIPAIERDSQAPQPLSRRHTFTSPLRGQKAIWWQVYLLRTVAVFRGCTAFSSAQHDSIVASPSLRICDRWELPCQENSSSSPSGFGNFALFCEN